MSKYWSIEIVCTCTFFVVIAATIGNGILALPCELVYSGFYPMFFSFIVPLLFEIMTNLLFIQVIQIIQVKINEDNIDGGYKKIAKDEKMANLLEEERGEEKEKKINESKMESFFISKGIDLHRIGKCFFCRGYSLVFDVASFSALFPLLYLVGAVRSYVLIFPFLEDPRYLILPTVLFFLLVVIFFHKIIETFITISTVLKGLFLLLAIFLGIIISFNFNNTIKSDYSYISRPFFIENYAMSGLVVFIPMIYSKVEPKKKNILFFIISIIVSLVFCWVLIILWSLIVLHIVPQDSGDINLRRSLDNGELSIKPVSNIIRKSLPEYTWITTIIDIFVSISLTTSLVLHLSALKHFMDGFIKEFQKRKAGGSVIALKISSALKNNENIVLFLIMNFILFVLLCFLSVFFNQGFELLMETYGITYQSGFYTFFVYSIFIIESFKRSHWKIDIPLRIFKSSRIFFIFTIIGFLYTASLFSYGIIYTTIRIFYSIDGKRIPF